MRAVEGVHICALLHITRLTGESIPAVMAYIDPGMGQAVGGVLAPAAALIASILAGTWIALKRRPGRLLLILAAVLGSVLVITLFSRQAKGPPGAEHSTARRVIVLGLDGLSPTTIDRMMKDGELPMMARLAERGTYSRLKTTTPAQSPVAWATFATGCNPGVHGIFDFIERDPATYLPKLSITHDHSMDGTPARQGTAFWEHASAAGIPMTIIQCPVTFPPEAISGRMLSGMGTPDIRGTQGTYTLFTTASPSDAADAPQSGRVVPISHAPNIELPLPGPLRKTLRGTMEPVHTEILALPSADGVLIRIGESRTEARIGEWTPWVRAEFKLGPLRKVTGIVRFHLLSIEPELEIYASPVCIDPVRPVWPISHPPEYAEDIATEVGLFNTRGMPFDTWAVNEGHLPDEAFLQQVDDVVEHRLRLLDLELRRFEEGLLFVYFEDSDILQHMFWRGLDSSHPAYDSVAAEHRDVVPEMYRRMDGIVGKVMEAMREGDVLLAFSDHGFTAFRRAAHVNSWLVRHGYMHLRDGADEGGDLLADVDWSRTKAYAVGFGGVYLNLTGRERDGIVEPDQAQAFTDEIAERLGRWEDADGTPVVRSVYRAADIYHGPAVSEAPDLIIGFSDGYRASWQTALGAAPDALVENNTKKWSGDHLVDPPLVPGVLFSNIRLDAEDAGLEDLAPTLLHALGMEPDLVRNLGMDGRSLLVGDGR